MNITIQNQAQNQVAQLVNYFRQMVPTTQPQVNITGQAANNAFAAPNYLHDLEAAANGSQISKSQSQATLLLPNQANNGAINTVAGNSVIGNTAIGYNHIGYGSLPYQQHTIVPEELGKVYNKGKLIIPPAINELAGELFKGSLANMFSQDWQKVVAVAANANGGLGSTEEGFLAWSKDGHFVRLLNPDISPEQNRRLALMSLQGGFSVEDLPSRLSFADFSDPAHFDEKAETVLGRHDTELQKFLQDPTKKYSVADGRSRYEMIFDKESGQVGSVYYKMARGIKGWVQRNFKWISAITSVVSTVGSFIPGWGTIASAISKGVQFVADKIARR